ncbi:hypothetical protein PC116_g27470 [Phytophthora cactorum]|uniref:Uncharacterized protein n=1 Tax=Phytophthora cactorum TaxID=29920 RepID=A0A8T1B7Y5_9STRA|nr:hypothetical protein PC114_g20563 [Phytophthora cactorum]KAG2898325.1 hypothetical protein PC117_g22586 [Phytophthora cactorum]KAG2970000.1 hypothetical protein PC119_g23757 [Phytophthora cactorum]KAG3129072.1 hypothetical protein C6341_g24288 [Phytophthora cactorum]KAG4224069.1 hypothetical protein PC116_g27470 [Phytophthora cactorum]
MDIPTGVDAGVGSATLGDTEPRCLAASVGQPPLVCTQSRSPYGETRALLLELVAPASGLHSSPSTFGVLDSRCLRKPPAKRGSSSTFQFQPSAPQ